GATDDRVVVLYHQRGVSPKGERFDGEVIGLYDMRDFTRARADVLLRRGGSCSFTTAFFTVRHGGPPFPALADGHRLVRYDRRGYGRSSARAADSNLDDLSLFAALGMD